MSSPAGTPQRSWRPSTAVRRAIAGERIDLATLLARRVIFVAGKGGTGRSTMTAALALLGARARQAGARRSTSTPRVTSPPRSGRLPPGFAPRVVQHDLSVLELRTDESFQEYLNIYFKVPRLTRLTPLARVFDFIATGVPGSARHARGRQDRLRGAPQGARTERAGVGSHPRRLCRGRSGGITSRRREGDAHTGQRRHHPSAGRVDRRPDPGFAPHHRGAVRAS